MALGVRSGRMSFAFAHSQSSMGGLSGSSRAFCSISSSVISLRRFQSVRSRPSDSPKRFLIMRPFFAPRPPG